MDFIFSCFYDLLKTFFEDFTSHFLIKMKFIINLYKSKHFADNDCIHYYMGYEKNILSKYFTLIMKVRYITFVQYEMDFLFLQKD